MLSHADLLDELRRLKDEGVTSNAALGRLLGIPPSRVADIFAVDRKARRITVDEMKVLVDHFELVDGSDSRPNQPPRSATQTRKSVSETIQSAMTRKRLKQTELAEMVGVEQSTVNRWVNGVRRPDAEVIPRLAIALEVQPHELASVDMKAIGVVPAGDHSELIDLFGRLTDDQQRLALDLFRHLAAD